MSHRLVSGAAALCAEAAAAFEARFGRPDVAAVAPGRVNLIGEHTDYNQGFVLPMAIDRHAVAFARRATPSQRPRLQVASALLGETVEIPLDEDMQPGPPAWANYLRGVVAEFALRGVEIPSLDVLVTGDVPLGGGLSSSAALEVAMATLLEEVTGHRLDPVDKARLCQRAEHRFAGTPCGIMDQMASVLGDEQGALLIDCRIERATPVRWPKDRVVFLLSDSRVKHTLGDGAYARRRAECEAAAAALGVPSLRDLSPAALEAAEPRLDALLFRRARHVVTENARTLAAAAALQKGDFAAVGQLMLESHQSLREDYEVSCPELDILVELGMGLGGGAVLGARMTGGGFGGSTVTLVEADAARQVADELGVRYFETTGQRTSPFIARPAPGARSIAVAGQGAP